MSEDLKFQQRWEFRRRDSDVDSSSDNSKLSSSGEPVLKKHKLVSSLISPENDETNGTPRSHKNISLIVVQGINSKLGKLTRLDQSRGDSDRITSLVELGSGYGKTNEKPNGRRNIFEEAKNLDILVKDKNGDTYMVPNTTFDVGML